MCKEKIETFNSTGDIMGIVYAVEIYMEKAEKALGDLATLMVVALKTGNI